ncbi:hypothetical protein N7456_008386 [Penicillium angulare]|uniref:DUF7704 domain-containing protein n=1 Tax=Penicillium angulare TaxID=116970 RepID=A0A9W9K997_9EURO|nr:hypothetical protein N7456_008386 [Penicillium angulare]
MASIMPPIPRAFFLYGEPCLVFFGGFLNPVLNPSAITSLLPPHLAGRGTSDPYPTPMEHLLGLQTATMMFMTVLLNLTIMLYAKNPKVVHGFVLSSALTDIPHWGSLIYVLGWEGLSQWRTWDSSLWAQFLVPAFTMCFKLGYLTGAFGADRLESEDKKQGKKSN